MFSIWEEERILYSSQCGQWICVCCVHIYKLPYIIHCTIGTGLRKYEMKNQPTNVRWRFCARRFTSSSTLPGNDNSTCSCWLALCTLLLHKSGVASIRTTRRWQAAAIPSRTKSALAFTATRKGKQHSEINWSCPLKFFSNHFFLTRIFSPFPLWMFHVAYSTTALSFSLFSLFISLRRVVPVSLF